MADAPFSIKGVEFYGEWRGAKKPYRLPRHKNGGLEIVLVSKGQLRWEVEDKEVELRANMLFYTLPWQEHGGVEEMQPSCEISYLCIQLDRDYLKPQRRLHFHPAFGFAREEERFISSSLLACKAQAIPSDHEAAWLFNHFFRLTREASPLRQSRARDTIKLLVMHLSSLVVTGQKSESRIAEAERRARKITTILATRYAEPWDLQSMSEACRLGRTQFSQLLKKYTGDTPVTYLNRVRLREAQRLLAESMKPITEIALAVGFNSSQYFATVFKEFTGLDARSFRAQAQLHNVRKRR